MTGNEILRAMQNVHESLPHLQGKVFENIFIGAFIIKTAHHLSDDEVFDLIKLCKQLSADLVGSKEGGADDRREEGDFRDEDERQEKKTSCSGCRGLCSSHH